MGFWAIFKALHGVKGRWHSLQAQRICVQPSNGDQPEILNPALAG
jgi:hypothetical protein